MNELEQYPFEPKKSHTKLIIAIVIVLLVGIGAYLYFTSAPSLPSIVTKPIVKEIPVVDVVLASSIDNKFNYEVQPNKEYFEGNPMFVYIAITDFSINKNSKVDLSEDVEIKDSQNNVMFAKSKFANVTDKVTSRQRVLLKNAFKTTGWKPGNYVLNVRINDNVAKKSTMKAIDFVIKKVPVSQFISTIDLSGIVSNSDSASDLTRTQIIRNPSGAVIQELNVTQPIIGDLSNLNLKFIDASFAMPERFDAGTYSVKFIYINTKTGKATFAEGKVVLDKKFAISEFIFANKINDDYTYEAQPNKEYKEGSNVLVYLKLINFAQPLVKGNYSVRFVQDVEIHDKAGKSVLSQKGYVKINDLNIGIYDGYNIKNSISFLQKGDYVYKALVKDLNGGQEAIREEAFSIN